MMQEIGEPSAAAPRQGTLLHLAHSVISCETAPCGPITGKVSRSLYTTLTYQLSVATPALLYSGAMMC